MKVKVLVGPLKVRPNHNTDNTSITQYTIGTILDVDLPLFEATENLVKNGVVIQKVGDKWAHVVAGSVSGWVAVVHMGTTYCQVIDDTTVPTEDVIEIVKAVVTYTVNGVEYTEELT